jgi:hypothetical protein
MKTALLVLCCLCATAAFGQVGGGALSNEPQVLVMPSHPQQAYQHAMGERQSLLEASGPSSAHGVRPLWEVAPPVNAVPLGDVARTYRKEHATAKKAVIIWNN